MIRVIDKVIDNLNINPSHVGGEGRPAGEGYRQAGGGRKIWQNGEGYRLGYRLGHRQP